VSRFSTALHVSAVFLCVVAGITSIRWARSVDAEPVGVCFDPPRQDLGKLKQLQTVLAEAVLLNKTQKRIRITSVDATCGCTKPILKTDVLEPGASEVLKVEIQMGYRRNAFSSAVIVSYMADGSDVKESVTWSIQGDVETEYKIEPESLAFSEQRDRLNQHIHISSQSVANFTLSRATCSHRAFRVAYSKDAVPGEWTIEVTFVPESTSFPVGRHWLSVSTNATVQPDIQIPLYVTMVESGKKGLWPIKSN
jgi:hypothetical protein